MGCVAHNSQMICHLRTCLPTSFVVLNIPIEFTCGDATTLNLSVRTKLAQPRIERRQNLTQHSMKSQIFNFVGM
jgi:hypothetical protein